jgi:hypothetical protein
MRARVDIDEDFPAEKLIEKIYDREFIAELSQRFGFDGSDASIVEELWWIGSRYILGRRFEGEETYAKEDRATYRRLLLSIEKFEGDLTGFELDLIHHMFLVSRWNNEPKPQTDFPHLSDHQKKRGEPYYFELLRMLSILKIAVEGEVDRNTPRGGRPKNGGLVLAIPQIGYLWELGIGRRFSIDHHKGVGLTEAFEFVKALLIPLDDISDTQIVTAMRVEIKSRRTHNNLNDISFEVIDSGN